MTPSCRNCKHAYLRTKETAHYNFECCGIGAAPLVVNMPSDARCDLWDRRTIEALPPRSNIIWGEPLNL